MLSYWEQESFTRYHHVVIGAGIVGLITAIELKEHFPKQSVLVLERGILPTGASTRNAGFACMGSVTELLDDLNYMTEQEVIALFTWRKKGLELLRARLGDAAIDYQENGSYELISTKEAHALNKIDYFNKLLSNVCPKPAFSLANEQIPELGFNASYTQALISNNYEGELNSGLMMRALTNLAIAKGIEIKTGAETLGYHEENEYVSIKIADALRGTSLQLKADTITLCTNAFTKQLMPEANLTPGRGQVLITEPVYKLPFRGIFHFDAGYYYFREINGRVLLGGGRNLDFETEATTQFELNQKIQNDLEDKLTHLILPGIPYTVANRWTGIMAFGNNKFPVVRAFSKRVFGAFRMGGMGIALGSEAARMVALLIKENT